MTALRAGIGLALGFAGAFLFLDVVAALLYALPRAIANAVRGFVRWAIVPPLISSTAVYVGLLAVIFFVGRWLATNSSVLLFGAGVATIAKLSNLGRLQADVDNRLWRNADTDMTGKETPTWATRHRALRP